MRYKTVIKIECNAFDEEDAYYTAGEYLCGNITDPGITMRCRTKNLFRSRIMKIGFAGMLVIMLLTVIM